MKTKTRKWSKVLPGDRVSLGGTAWTVKKVRKLGDTNEYLVILVAGKEFRSLPFKGSVEVILNESPTKAPEASKPKKSGKPDKPPLSGKAWTERTEAESLIEDKLGGKLIGIQVAEGPVVCQPVDPSTIKAHLWLLHDIEVTGSEGANYDRLVQLHASLHADPDSIRYPHVHQGARP